MRWKRYFVCKDCEFAIRSFFKAYDCRNICPRCGNTTGVGCDGQFETVAGRRKSVWSRGVEIKRPTT